MILLHFRYTSAISSRHKFPLCCGHLEPKYQPISQPETPHVITSFQSSRLIIMLTTENTNSHLKVHALHYANELLVRVRLSFQELLQPRSSWRNNTKKMFKSTDHDKPYFHSYVFMLFATISTSKKMSFFQSAS